MSVGDATSDRTAAPERLSLGVAARLARYLQVLTQAKKEGKETVSSQELSEWTHVNSTQIRRDLSGFGKFGKRGVGYNVDSLVSQIRKILRTAGQHNIALFGAGHLGKAIASSDIFADHGFRVVAIFDAEPARRSGQKVGQQTVRAVEDLRQTVLDEDIVVARARGADRGGPAARRRARRRGREDHLQLLRGAAAGAAGGHGPHVQPRRRPALRALLLPDVVMGEFVPIDLEAVDEAFAASTDATIGIEEEFQVLDAGSLDMVAALRGAARRGAGGPGAAATRSPAS